MDRKCNLKTIIFFFPWIEVSWIESEPNRKLTLAKVSLRKLSEKTHHSTFGIKYDFEVQTDLALLKKYIFIEKNTFVMNICIDLSTISNFSAELGRFGLRNR